MKALTLVGAALWLLAGCGGGGNGDAAQADAETAAEAVGGAQADESCVVVTYTMVGAGVTRSFTFNADMTGQEVHTPDDIRPLSWSLRDAETIHIIYPAQGDNLESQWDLGFNCAEKYVASGGGRYTKP